MPGRSLKVHFLAAEGAFSPFAQYTFSQVFDIRNDPGLEMEFWAAGGYSHLWVMKPVVAILTDLAISMKVYPNISPGEDFDGYKKARILEDPNEQTVSTIRLYGAASGSERARPVAWLNNGRIRLPGQRSGGKSAISG